LPVSSGSHSAESAVMTTFPLHLTEELKELATHVGTQEEAERYFAA
jgi:hypothetical protein